MSQKNSTDSGKRGGSTVGPEIMNCLLPEHCRLHLEIQTKHTSVCCLFLSIIFPVVFREWINRTIDWHFAFRTGAYKMANASKTAKQNQLMSNSQAFNSVYRKPPFKCHRSPKYLTNLSSFPNPIAGSITALSKMKRNKVPSSASWRCTAWKVCL